MSEVKTPWKDYMGDVPMHLEYFQGTMFEAVENIAHAYPCLLYTSALSHAPPALDMNTAIAKPVTDTPPSRPTTPVGPRIRPVRMGTTTARIAGATISCRAPLVHRSTQAE